jgi:hypothetical protein
LGCYLWGYMKSLLNTVKLSTHGWAVDSV